MPPIREPHPKTHCGDLAAPPAALTAMCLMRNWVTWKWQRAAKKWTKPPFRCDDPTRLAANNDPSSWGTRSAAVAAVLAGRADGIGFSLTGTEIGAIDLDHCRDPETGAIDAWAQEILDAAPGAYKEITVSGAGLRVLGCARGGVQHKKFTVSSGQPDAAIEVYRKAVRYITVSGFEIGQCVELPNIDALIDDLVARHGGNGSGNGFDFDGGEQQGERLEEPKTEWTEREEARVRGALKFIPAADRQVWLRVGMALHWTEWKQARAIWDSWSETCSEKYEKNDQQKTWRGFRTGRDQEVTLATLFALAIDYGWEETADNKTASLHDWDDPDPSVLDDRRGKLPSFPTDIFTPPIRGWLDRAAHGAGVSPDHVAVPLLGVASSLIGTARRVQASRPWSEPMTLWSGLVGSSGDRKTPGLNVVRRALDMIERDQVTAIAAARLAHETRVQRSKEAAKKWKEERQAAIEDKPPRDPPAMPMEALDPGNFIEPRLYATDPTIERLAGLLQVRPRGMMLLRDELAGLFANMGRYSGGSDRPFWLEAWVGGRHVVERVSGSIIIDHLLVGVIGGFQPDKLARAFAGDEDGMYGRFLFGWPSTPDYRPLTNEVSEVEPELQSALKALIRLPAEDADEAFIAQAVPLSQDAVEEFEAYRRYVDKLKRALDGLERQWLVKSESQVLRLAGTLTYLTWAFALGTPGSNGVAMITADLEPKKVGKEFMSAAVRAVKEYFWHHARAALRQIGLIDRHRNMRRVLRWISAHEKQEVSREEVRRDALGQSLDAEQVQQLLDSLVKAGWLRAEPTKTAGRTRRRWKVNPKLFALSVAESAGSAESPSQPHPFN